MLFTEHVVIPAAIIAMVAALLFYLLELREVLFGPGAALKQIGFCFVAATVLIARYGRANARANQEDLYFDPDSFPGERQELYSGCLATATLLAMIARSGSFGSIVFNLGMIALVWRFASRLTRSLSFEPQQAPAKEGQLYGLERLRVERLLKSEGESGVAKPSVASRKTGKGGSKGRDAHGNRSGPLARLILLALLTFALGEPLLVKAPAIIGQRAMAEVVIFLFAAALLLAAGSAAGSLRHVRRAKGLTSPYILPSRMAIGGLLAALVLALAMALPGTSFQGRGEARPATDAETQRSSHGQSSIASDSDFNLQNGQAKEAKPADQEKRERGKGKQENGEPKGEKQAQNQLSLSGPMGSLLAWLRSLGRLLLPFAVLIFILAGLYVAFRQRTRLFSFVAQAVRSLRNFWTSLWSRFGRKKKKLKVAKGDPFANLESLAAMPPRRAVLTAYERLLQAFEQAGHARFERQTPEEFLASIPGRLHRLKPPAANLTALYLLAAYSPAEPPPGAGESALEYLRNLGQHLEPRRET
jgi:hypothetical protein